MVISEIWLGWRFSWSEDLASLDIGLDYIFACTNIWLDWVMM